MTPPAQPPTEALPVCPGCGAEHDPRPCAEVGASCSRCAAMFAGQDERAAAAEALGRQGAGRRG